MGPVRFSTRERRSPVKIDEIYGKNRFGGIRPKKEEIFEVKEEELPEKIPPKTRPRARQICFSPDESLALMQFFIGEIQSKSEERQGRVAKRRVEIGDPNFWIRAKNSIGSWRSVTSLRAHYHFNCRKLHEFEGLTIEEKLDLYYAMDIKVDKSIRKKLEETYGIEFDENGIITGSSKISHWDVVHPESDVDNEETEISSIYSENSLRTSKFSELEDGLMWQFVLDGLNKKQGPTVYGKQFWAKYQKKNAKFIGDKRADETLRGRFRHILIPTLHKMPFDMETKAAVFQSLQNPVPEIFREKLIEETGVTIDEDGKVTDYPNRPDFLVLQSKNYEDVIGITSSVKLSTLRHPYPQATDDLEYSEEEDLKIWEYILERGRENGKLRRIRLKMSGWSFWMQFLKDRPMERTWKSLARHFTEDLMHNIMDTSFDLKTKLDLFYILSIPVDAETLQKFETIATVILRNNSTIDSRVPLADYSSVPKTERQDDVEEKPQNLINGSLNSKNLVEFMNKVAEDQKREIKEEKMDDLNMSNSARFPYLPWSVIRRKQKRSKKIESARARNQRILQLPPKADLPIFEEKPSDLLGPSTRPVSDNFVPKVAAHQLLRIPEHQQRIQERRSAIHRERLLEAGVLYRQSNFVEEIKEESVDYDHC